MLDREIRITPSLIDQLVDLDPRSPQDVHKARSLNVSELRQSVRRDMEWLLNARRIAYRIDAGLEEVQRSVFAYGIPDITATGAGDQIQQAELRKAIETAIRNFEPRLIHVKVEFEQVDNNQKQLRFRIEASLDIEPAPEPIVFDTVVEVGSGKFQVSDR
jgi:type VI secretion system protein ImpF